MTTSTHDRMVEEGLLGGPLDAATREAWPAWAREHAAACPICQRWVGNDALLGAVGPSRPPRPRPAVGALRARLASRAPAPLDALVGALPRFREARYRSRAQAAALELQRTPVGLRAYDPDATHLLLFAVARRGRPRLLGEARRPSAGVSVAIDWQPEGEARAVAIAACGRLNATIWQLWLSDRFQEPWPDRLDAAGVGDRLHLAELAIGAPARTQMLRVVAGELPPATDAVTAILKQAAALGRGANFEGAARAYQEALRQAHAAGDTTGEIKASMGVALAFDGLGFAADAQRMLVSVAERFELDHRMAESLSRALVGRALAVGDLERAETWLAEAKRVGGFAPAQWIATVEGHVAVCQADYPRVVAATAGFAAAAPAQAATQASTRSFALAALGAVEEAAGVLPATEGDIGLSEVATWAAAARVRLARARGEPIDFGALARRLGARIANDVSGLSAVQALPLGLIVDEARRTDPVAAALLVRLRFLGAEDALDPSVISLCAVARGGGILIVDAVPGAPIRWVARPPREVLGTIAEARHEALGAGDGPALRALRELLFPFGIPSGAPITVASDGLLADLPLPAVIAAGLAPSEPLPPLRELIRFPQGRARPPEVAAVASFADAVGDLPHAGREVGPSEAALFYRGAEARFDRMAELPAVGLLHVGVHARREHEVPALWFADVAAGPAEIAELRLQGSPVVLLSGCATGQRAVGMGVERSVAAAFLRAGASAVIATRWSVEDAEMYTLVRALMAEWPFRDAPVAVARVTSELRRQGLPSRVWASLAVSPATSIQEG